MASGFRVVGFDIEAHDYGQDKRYPAQLVIQDVLTIHGRQFKDVALIVASPPCQEYSYMAMPWSRAKTIAAEYRSGKRDVKKLTALFDACFRIQREAIEAAGHFIPMVVENVRGAQPWVGRAKWNFGSYYLWGDVPALMPITAKRALKSKGHNWNQNGTGNLHDASGVKAGNRNRAAAEGGHKWTTSFAENLDGLKPPGNNSPRRWDEREVQRLCDAPVEGFKTKGMNWSDRTQRGQDFTRIAGSQADGVKTVGHANKMDGHSHTRHLTNQAESDGVKLMSSLRGFSHPGGKGQRDLGGPNDLRRFSFKSNARKAASATIAKIPLPLSLWIGKVYKPTGI